MAKFYGFNGDYTDLTDEAVKILPTLTGETGGDKIAIIIETFSLADLSN